MASVSTPTSSQRQGFDDLIYNAIMTMLEKIKLETKGIKVDTKIIKDRYPEFAFWEEFYPEGRFRMFFGGNIIEDPKAFLKMAEQQIKFFLYCLKPNVIKEIIELGKAQKELFEAFDNDSTKEILSQKEKVNLRLNQLKTELCNGFLLQETPNLIQGERALNQDERDQMVSKVLFHIGTLFEMLGAHMGGPYEPGDYNKFNCKTTLRRFNSLLNRVNYLKAVLNRSPEVIPPPCTK